MNHRIESPIERVSPTGPREAAVVEVAAIWLTRSSSKGWTADHLTFGGGIRIERCPSIELRQES
jgi:hypothetical protein